MNALIVDDELANIENLQILLKSYCPKITGIASAIDKVAAQQAIEAQPPDILFLDIHLAGGTTGFDLLQGLTNKAFEVIFVTAFDKYGIEAIKFAALDYLLKPVSITELILAVSKAEERLILRNKGEQLAFLLEQVQNKQTPKSKIALPQMQEIRYVDVDHITHCRADNSYTSFYLTAGEEVLVSRPIREYTELLRCCGFVRTHQSYLVNISFVKSWLKEDGGVLLLYNGVKIPVSKPHRHNVKQQLQTRFIK